MPRQGVSFTVSSSEYQAITSAAVARGQTIADYLRVLALAGVESPSLPSQDEKHGDGFYFTMKLEPTLMHVIAMAAERRKIKPRQIVERLIETIAAHDLFVAVLDDQEPPIVEAPRLVGKRV